MKRQKRIYIAGPYSSGSVLGVLENIRRGQRAATELMLSGWAVFCPWLDHQIYLQLQGDEKLTVADFQKASMAWLEVSDAVYLLPGWRESKGTLAEIRRAMEIGIPITGYDHDELNAALVA